MARISNENRTALNATMDGTGSISIIVPSGYNWHEL